MDAPQGWILHQHIRTDAEPSVHARGTGVQQQQGLSPLHGHAQGHIMSNQGHHREVKFSYFYLGKFQEVVGVLYFGFFLVENPNHCISKGRSFAEKQTDTLGIVSGS